MNMKWDGEAYTENFSFVPQYGEDVLELLQVEQGKTVLDLGCGNGILTKKIADLGMKVVGLDASGELLKLARESYPQLTFYQGDATSFILPQQVEAVFSNAVFHWIEREQQRQMLACIENALKPGGELVCEFGGHGNTARIHQALAAAFARRQRIYRSTFYFPTIGEYAPLLESCGFRVSFAALFERPTALKGETGLQDWIRLFLVQAFAGIPEQEQTEIVEEAAAQLKKELYQDGTWYADYVRIRIKAEKVGLPPVE